MTLIVNGKRIPYMEGKTILEHAEAHDIFIPTLCAHKRLPSYGACRLCLVKVHGTKGFMSACSTPAKPDMVITTDSLDIKRLRRSIFELILSEHPSSCLLCDQAEHCDKFNSGVMKAGVITGCNTCPNKENCELREVAEQLNFKTIRFPIFYKGLPVERNDPFFDRDYNLCIHCGRCVRVCQEVEGAGILTFIRRGHDAKVGTAFEKPHIETACNFCGACVDVCPTGALSARGQKWYEEPDNRVITTCFLCSNGCQLELDVKWDDIVAVRPSPEFKSIKTGICVKGRFCLPTLLNSSERLSFPRIRVNNNLVPTNWDQAFTSVAEIFETYSASNIALYLTPFLIDEAEYLFLKFAERLSIKAIYRTPEDLKRIKKDKIKVLYATQGSPAIEKSNNLEEIILQEVFPTVTYPLASITLPAAAFTEEEGTITTEKGLLELHRVVKAPNLALPDWKILQKIAQALDLSGFDYQTAAEIREEYQRSDDYVPSLRKIDKYHLKYRGAEIANFVPDFALLLDYRQERDTPW
jgi:NADH dehydrogenase/NADH:ubiquinone oxidoreductase subunit G